MYKGLLILVMGVLLVGCSAEPSDEDIKSCIMNINGIDELGAEYTIATVSMKMDSIDIENIIENNDGYEAQVIYDYSFTPPGCRYETKEKREMMAVMAAKQGGTLDPETCFISQKSELLSYQFSKGSKGWSCSGESIF